MSEIIENIREVTLIRFDSMLRMTLTEANSHISSPQAELLASEQTRSRILDIFKEKIGVYFDKILGRHQEEKQQMLYFELLALAQKRELEEMITIEGMVASARNLCSPNFVPFNARLDSLTPRVHVDENNNPLDPDQITSAFEQSIQFLNLDALNRLSLFREFNENLLKQLDEMLTELNELLKEKGILPELNAKYAEPLNVAKPSKHQDDPELFSMMQGLLHKDSTTENTGSADTVEEVRAMIPTGSGIMQPVQLSTDKNLASRRVEVLDPTRLMSILDSIQKARMSSSEGQTPGNNSVRLFDPYEINESLGNLLSKAQSENAILAVDTNSSDVINLVTMLYGAIWQDNSLPVPIKNLIGDTQLTVTKLALSDTSFFNRENHPAREVINELANAGASWTEVEKLDQDPLYNKMQDLVAKLTLGYQGDNTLFDVALKDFRRYVVKEEKGKLKQLEEKISSVDDRQKCLDDIHKLVSKRINERLVGRKIHSFFRESLENFMHRYLVLVILKDGPEGGAWKQAINVLDVILWTLEFNKDRSDKKRVDTANSGILHHIKKVLKVSRLKENDIETLLASLASAQKESFDSSLYDTSENTGSEEASILNETKDGNVSSKKAPGSEFGQKPVKGNDPYLDQVDSFGIGSWVEINALEKDPIRCKLAAKIKAIDKYIFVNREGVKVAETSRTGLAKDLKEGKIKVVSDGLLLSRAMESVIGSLQDSQDQQRIVTAFQPDT